MQTHDTGIRKTRLRTHYRIATAAMMLAPVFVSAHELTENLSLDGVLSGAAQCQVLSEDTAGENTCKGAAPLQPELTYRPSRHHRFFLKLGFAAGNGLNEVTPFNIPPWGADVENDVKNVNGSGRDHLLNLWYEFVHEFEPRNRLELTAGIIDASEYLDQNAFANDEYMQFMNPALSNAPNTILPSYDLGMSAEWWIGQWSFAGVVMDVHQFTRDDNYTFYGLQAGYRLESSLGTGNYRVLLNADRNLIDLTGRSRQKNDILIFSFDQQLGKTLGAFTRFGWRLDDDTINYSALYSGGIDIKGTEWGRLLDNVGIGLVYLDGGNNRIRYTRIAEAYYRMVINPYLALTGDVQYTRDEYFTIPGAEGFIFSLRGTVNF